MTYFADGSPYEYNALEGPAVNVGWLDQDFDFPKGPVPREFIAVLTELCRSGVLAMRGTHYCNLCLPRQQWSGYESLTPAKVESATGDFYVGNAEIRVAGPDGITFAAPNMIIHYVIEHGYRPPDAFVAAVLSSA